MSRPAPSRAARRRPSPSTARIPGGHDLAMALRVAYLTMHRRANAEFARLGLTAD